MIKVVCWNIAKRKEPWKDLAQMGADVALLQEAGKPPSDMDPPVGFASRAPWEPQGEGTCDRWTAVVKLSDRVEVKWFKRVFLKENPEADELPVSENGTIAAAEIRPLDPDGKPFIAVSMCANWLKPTVKSSWTGYSDASAHRIVSDLSTFIGHKDPSRHRILAAGDLNIIYGAKNNNRYALSARDDTVFKRMDALGLEFLGPQAPNGRSAKPTPSGLPEDAANVPTFHSNRQTPATAENQLDYVFASRGFHESVTVRAMNGVDKDEWGPSDHCRLWIEIK